MMIENDNHNPSVRWTTDARDWVIEDTRKQPALFLQGVDFAFANLTATDNEPI